MMQRLILCGAMHLLSVTSEGADLHEAVRACDVARLRGLLNGNVDLNAQDEAGLTPLLAAIDARKPVCIEMVLAAGADRNGKDRKGRTPLQAILQIADGKERAAVAVLYFRVQKVGVDAAAPAMPWTLEYAIARGQRQVVEMLLGMGADPNQEGRNGSTPLADACRKGDIEVVRVLLERGAKPELATRAGTLPLHEAALGDQAAVIEELTRRGVDVNARDRDSGQTALHYAAALGRLEAIRALLASQADRTLRDREGRTPLEVARRAGLEEAARILYLR